MQRPFSVVIPFFCFLFFASSSYAGRFDGLYKFLAPAAISVLAFSQGVAAETSLEEDSIDTTGGVVATLRIAAGVALYAAACKIGERVGETESFHRLYYATGKVIKRIIGHQKKVPKIEDAIPNEGAMNGLLHKVCAGIIRDGCYQFPHYADPKQRYIKFYIPKTEGRAPIVIAFYHPSDSTFMSPGGFSADALNGPDINNRLRALMALFLKDEYLKEQGFSSLDTWIRKGSIQQWVRLDLVDQTHTPTNTPVLVIGEREGERFSVGLKVVMLKRVPDTTDMHEIMGILRRSPLQDNGLMDMTYDDKGNVSDPLQWLQTVEEKYFLPMPLASLKAVTDEGVPLTVDDLKDLVRAARDPEKARYMRSLLAEAGQLTSPLPRPITLSPELHETRIPIEEEEHSITRERGEESIRSKFRRLVAQMRMRPAAEVDPELGMPQSPPPLRRRGLSEIDEV